MVDHTTLRDEAAVVAYFHCEIEAYQPEAWIDRTSGRRGYAISFSRFFFTATPLRSLAAIDADLKALHAAMVIHLQAEERTDD